MFLTFFCTNDGAKNWRGQGEEQRSAAPFATRLVAYVTRDGVGRPYVTARRV